jgi:hypothetical protein
VKKITKIRQNLNLSATGISCLAHAAICGAHFLLQTMIDYHIDQARNLAITRATGRITVAEVTAHLVRMMRDPAFHPDLNALIVAGNVETVPGPIGIGALTPLVRAWSKRRAGVKWAFVLPDKATRDIVESALQEARLTALTTHCFISESAALVWLEPAPAGRVANKSGGATTIPAVSEQAN